MLTMFAAVSTLNLATSGLLSGTASGPVARAREHHGQPQSAGAVINLRCSSSSAIGWSATGRWAAASGHGAEPDLLCGRVLVPFFVAMAVAPPCTGSAIGQHTAFWHTGGLAGHGADGLAGERLGVETFEGYPLRLQTLGLPVTLALLVLVIHRFWPGLSILAVIAWWRPLLACCSCRKRARGCLKRQVVERFPAIGGQLVLFLGPFLLAAGINSALSVLDFGSGHGLPLFNHFGWLEACLTLLLIFPGGHRGCIPHQHLGVALLLWLAPDPSLLGMCFLMGGAGDRDEPASGSIWRWRPATT